MKNYKGQNIVLIVAILFFFGLENLCGQTKAEKDYEIWNNTSLNDSIRADAYYSIVKDLSTVYPDSSLVMAKELLQFAKNKKLKYHEAHILGVIGLTHYNMDQYNDALDYFLKSLELSKQLDDKESIANNLLDIGLIYQANFDFKRSLDYFKESLELSKQIDNGELIALCFGNIGGHYLQIFKNDKAIEYYTLSLEKAQALENKKYLAYAYGGLGKCYTRAKDYDNAVENIQKSLTIYKSISNDFGVVSCLSRLTKCYLEQENYPLAIQYGKEGLKLAEKLNNQVSKRQISFYLYQIYKKLDNYKEALYHYENYFDNDEGYNFVESNKKLADLEIKRGKEKDSIIQVQNKQLHQAEIGLKDKQSKNITFAWIGSVVLISLLGFLMYKNAKRKQKIIENEKELQEQKFETLLKEQELLAIDAMIEGQEKERQLLANDLHDNLGSLMATIKWHFETLKKEKNEELLEKTSTLLDEAYQKIRGIAHTKNSGVLASKGLLVAIEKLINSVSLTNKLKIEVVANGLDTRLENSLELSLFRIIQELVTNVLKHANATEATIYLTKHETTITIMVEDNGKGFNIKSIEKTKGIGISTIEKRVENFGGKVIIESKINKGTAIIIDIPL